MRLPADWKVFTGPIVLLVAATAIAVFAWRHATRPDDGLEAFNRGVAFAAENRVVNAADEFTVALQQATFDSDVSIHARYNLAGIRAEEQSFKALTEARSLLEDVLRQRPDDEDARRNLEIVIGKLRRVLQNEGYSEQAADDVLEAQNLAQTQSDRPDEGSQMGHGAVDEKDY